MSDQTGNGIQPSYGSRLKSIFALFLVGRALKIPFLWSLLRSSLHSGLALVVIESPVMIGAIALGLYLSGSLGIRATPIIDLWLEGRSIARKLATAIVIASLVAIAVQAFQLLRGSVAAQPGIVLHGGRILQLLVIAGLGAGLDEEAECRLGLMVCVYWLLARMPGLRSKRGSALRFLLANLLQAVYFGLRHQFIQVGTRHGLSLIVAATGGHAIAGFVWGILFWVSGYETAALSHSIYDSGTVLIALALAK